MSNEWTIITVTYNSSESLSKCWTVGVPSGVRWIVVDNCSTDGSADLAESLGADVIRQETNLGFSAGNNVGLRAATSEFIGFVNPDVVVDFASLPRMARLLESKECLLAPQLRNEDGSCQPNGRGHPTLVNKLRNRLTQGDTDYQLIADAETERDVCWLMGAVVLGRQETFRRLDGWDERFFVYYEDSDLGLRAWRQGIPVVVTGKASWTHGWARETKHFAWQPWRREMSSMTKFYARYPDLLFAGRVSQRRSKVW